ncbi:unnamed protein product [Prunus armeniaca]
MSVTSHGGNKYFISFIDDFSRKVWVYFLKKKSEAFQAFKDFKAEVEKFVGFPIKTLRTDRGGEYLSNEFEKYCRNHGLMHQLTTRYTPQQNGVSERKNQTIMEMVRSMLKNKNLQKELWAEAVTCAIYLINRSPTKALNDCTPHEAWYGMKPSVHYLRIFGSVAYAHVPDAVRNKLDDKSEKCIFIGYSERSKAYKLYNPKTKKFLVSRDVRFDEYSDFYDHGASSTLQDDSDDYCHSTNDSSQSSPRPATNGSEGPSQTPIKMRSLEEIYESARHVDLPNEAVYFAFFAGEDPISFDDASKEEKWKRAMDEEIKAIEKNDTWELTDLPEHKDPIGVKWVYKTKMNPNGSINKYKARLVAKGYKQKEGKYYIESAFFNGVLNEEVYLEQPHGYVKRGEEKKVFKLRKALHGLKQSPRAWYSCINSYFEKNGLQKCPYKHTLYIKNNSQGSFMIVSLYVDDLIFTGNNLDMLNEFKLSMMREFEMTDLGELHHFLGIEVNQSKKGIFISQESYAKEVLKKFRMENANPVSTPCVIGLKLSKDGEGKLVNSTMFRSLVGNLMYLTATRPDIMFSVSLVSRFMEKPYSNHWDVVKRILRYVKGTVDYGIFYEANIPINLVGYTDSDLAGSVDDCKSTFGYVFNLGSGVFSWSSKKQPIVALSTTEAEYIAASYAGYQIMWL